MDVDESKVSVDLHDHRYIQSIITGGHLQDPTVCYTDVSCSDSTFATRRWLNAASASGHNSIMNKRGAHVQSLRQKPHSFSLTCVSTKPVDHDIDFDHRSQSSTANSAIQAPVCGIELLHGIEHWPSVLHIVYILLVDIEEMSAAELALVRPTDSCYI